MYTYLVFTVFYYLFGRTERLPTQGGQERVLSPEQETEIMNMVLENNAITLRQIQRKIIENNDMFQNLAQGLHYLSTCQELRYNYVQVSPTIDAYSQHCIQ